MAYHYNTRARARSDVEPDDIGQGNSALEMATAMVSDTTFVGRQVESTEELESMSTEVAGPVTTHSQLLPEGDHSSVGGMVVWVCQLFLNGGYHPGIPQWTCRPT